MHTYHYQYTVYGDLTGNRLQVIFAGVKGICHLDRQFM